MEMSFSRSHWRVVHQLRWGCKKWVPEPMPQVDPVRTCFTTASVVTWLCIPLWARGGWGMHPGPWALGLRVTGLP